MRPTHAFRSPPAMRSTIRSGQPRKMSAPIIMMKPRTKRVIGDDPAVERYSRVARAIRNEPTTRPTISGRKYCTVSVVCSFKDPAMSRMKHAAHIAMLPGLPKYASSAMPTPTTTPTRASPFLLLRKSNGVPFL